MPTLSHVDSLRSKARGAIVSGEKAKARNILGELIKLSNEPSDQKNLRSLIHGVQLEVDKHTRKHGSIQSRLENGLNLDAIQEELNVHILYWRAFANDLKDLELARDGLPAHRDPKLKERLKVLEKQLAEGLVKDVLSEWNNLGAPEEAAGGLFLQIVRGFLTVLDEVDQGEWQRAEIYAGHLVALLESEEASSFRDGCKKYLDPLKRRIDWELILLKQTGEGKEGSKQRRILLADLFKAKDEIQRQIGNDTTLKGLLDRVEEAIEIIIRERPEQPPPPGGVKVVLVILAALLMIVVLIWLYMRVSGDQSGSINLQHPFNPHNQPISIITAYT